MPDSIRLDAYHINVGLVHIYLILFLCYIISIFDVTLVTILLGQSMILTEYFLYSCYTSVLCMQIWFFAPMDSVRSRF